LCDEAEELTLCLRGDGIRRIFEKARSPKACGLFYQNKSRRIEGFLASIADRQITARRQDFDATLDLRIFQIENLKGADRTIGRRRIS